MYPVQSTTDQDELSVRISSAKWTGEMNHYNNDTIFIFSASLEAWNEGSDDIIIEYKDTCKMIIRLSYFPTNENMDLQNRWQNQFPLGCGDAITPVTYEPGTTTQFANGGISFSDLNLTELPSGMYRLEPDVSGDAIHKVYGTNITVSDNETITKNDSIPQSWGEQYNGIVSGISGIYVFVIIVSIITVLRKWKDM